jgi:hypothetical protein
MIRSFIKLNSCIPHFNKIPNNRFLLRSSITRKIYFILPISSFYQFLSFEKFYRKSSKEFSFVEVFDTSQDATVYPSTLLDPTQTEGLFALPIFSATDWMKLVDIHVKKCKEVIDSLENFKDLHPSEVVPCF